MSTQALDHQTTHAEVYDSALRFTIASRSRPHVVHMVDLDCYHLNGRCSCEKFTFNFEPLLRRNVTPEEAVAAGYVKLAKDQDPEDALRCQHIMDAYWQLGISTARAFAYAKKNPPTPPIAEYSF